MSLTNRTSKDDVQSDGQPPALSSSGSDLEKSDPNETAFQTLPLDADGASSIEDNAGGAPTEKTSPLGYDVGVLSAVMLNVSQMVGSGIFSTPGVILKSVGSPGLSLIFWIVGPLIAFAGLSVYTELAAMFPKRSGAEVAYLEQAYRKPKFFFPVTFALTTVLLSFSASNAIVFARYVLSAAGKSHPSSVLIRGIAIAVVSGSSLLAIVSRKWSFRIVNILSIIKLITLLFIVITGFVVLGGGTSVADPKANFRNGFAGTTNNGNGIATALVKVNYAFSGWSNANNLLGEMKDPVKTVKRAGFGALALVSLLYFFANIAFFAAVTKEEMSSSGQLVAAVFFRKVFGDSAAAKVLPILIAISALGNIIAVIVGQARVIREIGRQGVLPLARMWSSTWPFGTPVAPILLKWAFTILVLIAIPTGDAFNFMIDLASYPSLTFAFATALGVYILRRRFKREGSPLPAFRAWHVSIILTMLSSIFLLVMPWVPPETGATGGDVSFWYATYCAVGIGILLACLLYYYLWIVLLPKWRGYEMQERVEVLANGELTKVLVRVWHDK